MGGPFGWLKAVFLLVVFKVMSDFVIAVWEKEREASQSRPKPKPKPRKQWKLPPRERWQGGVAQAMTDEELRSMVGDDFLREVAENQKSEGEEGDGPDSGP